MVRSPAGTGQRPSRARDQAAHGCGHPHPLPLVVGHAGLAIRRPGGSPTRRHLDEALELGLDRLELDLCSTADGVLVVRHDACLADGRFIGDLHLAELRRNDQFLLTLDEVVEHLEGRVPLTLDLKMARAAEELGRWFSERLDLDGYSLCTENLTWLLHLRFAAPRVARWPSFPDLGDRSTHHVQRVLAGLWYSHASVEGLRRGAADVRRAARQLRHRPHDSLASLAGLPWRDRLPLQLSRACQDVAASGICVQKWLISERLVEEAHRAGLHVNAWTINTPDVAQTVAAAGVDSITTDRVATVRLALGIGRSPRATADERRRRLRAVARTSPT